MSRADDAGDPRPAPPQEPMPEECCQRGCDPCIYDRYYDAMERYREALDLWLDRHPEARDAPPGA